MKKREMKLVLAKETVRTLTGVELADQVQGGATSGCFTTGCESRIQHCFSPPTGG